MEHREKQNTVFTQQDIEKHLQSALAAATPDVWSKLDLSAVQERPAKSGEKNGRKISAFHRRFGGLCAAACVCLTVMGGGYYHYEYVQVVSEVGIDVNPSLKLLLNRKDRVTEAQGLNEDGQALLADTNLKGNTVEDAVDQVMSSLVDQGYLNADGAKNTVLVSVSGRNQKKAEAVKTEVSANVEKTLTEKQVNAVVYDQTIQVTDELKELAETYQVSPGKAEFVGLLVNENDTLNSDTQSSYERMMGQTMEELTQEIQENEYYVSSKVTIIKAEPVSKQEERELAGRDRDEKRDRQENSADKEVPADKEAAVSVETDHENGAEVSESAGDSAPAEETTGQDTEQIDLAAAPQESPRENLDEAVMEPADVPQETEPREEEVFTSWEPEEKRISRNLRNRQNRRSRKRPVCLKQKRKRTRQKPNLSLKRKCAFLQMGLPRLRMQPQKRIRRISGRMKAAQKKAFRKMRKIQNSLVKRLRFQRQSRKRTRIESRSRRRVFPIPLKRRFPIQNPTLTQDPIRPMMRKLWI